MNTGFAAKDLAVLTFLHCRSAPCAHTSRRTCHPRQQGWEQRAFTVLEDEDMVDEMEDSMIQVPLAADKAKIGPNLEIGDVIQYECDFSRGLMHAITVFGKREISR